MDKSCHSSGESTSSSITNNNRDHYLNHLNKISHKISKPTIKKPTFDSPPPPPPPLLPPQQAQSQPPVYNINKSDFRDVVQKLTGSPAHERFSNPPPIQTPKPPSSRLQRIRPPPLAQISNLPPPLLNTAVPPNHQRLVQPLSPLPPFPAVHAAAESPISAYMRYLHNTISTVDSDPKRFSAISPLAPPPTSAASTAQSQFPMASSPLPFGCLPSPRSPYPLLSPNLMGQLGFQQFPVSPRLSVPSPRWKE